MSWLSLQIVILKVEFCLVLKIIIIFFLHLGTYLPFPVRFTPFRASSFPSDIIFLLEELSLPLVGAPVCWCPKLFIRGRFLFRVHTPGRAVSSCRQVNMVPAGSRLPRSPREQGCRRVLPLSRSLICGCFQDSPFLSRFRTLIRMCLGAVLLVLSYLEFVELGFEDLSFFIKLGCGVSAGPPGESTTVFEKRGHVMYY